MNAAAVEALRQIGRGVLAFADAVQGDGETSPADLVPIEAAAKIAATSRRVLTEAGRRGELVLFGGQRDRAVRRADLDAWIESRRVTRAASPPSDDRDLDSRIRRIEARAAGGQR